MNSINVSGIQCDHCDFIDPSVKFKDYSKYINKPCPKCGANLLTQQAYDSTISLIEMVESINALMGVQDEQYVNIYGTIGEYGEIIIEEISLIPKAEYEQ